MPQLYMLHSSTFVQCNLKWLIEFLLKVPSCPIPKKAGQGRPEHSILVRAVESMNYSIQGSKSAGPMAIVMAIAANTTADP
jgi:hypothetical protein